MVESIKKGDFIEIEYTGKIEGQVFDTTDEAMAKSTGIHRPGMPYGSVIVCVGEGHLLKGLDKAVEGKELNKEHTVKIQPEDAFGKKDAKLIQLIPKHKFKQGDINPVPGMQVNIDGALATIKTVSGGRILVDFNHPLAGREVEYTFKILKKVTDQNEKVQAVIAMELNLKKDGYELEIKENKAKIKFKKEAQIPEKIQELLGEKIKKSTGIKEVEFKSEKA